MSVVVAIKKDGVVYLGADSQVTRGGTRTSLSNPNNYKIWKVKNVDNCLMGHVGVLRDACVVRIIDNLVREIDVLHDSVDFEYVVSRIVPMIIGQLQEYNYLAEDEVFKSTDSKYLFAYNDKLFVIGFNGDVIEVDDCVAIGSGESEAIGSLITTMNEDNPTKRIIMAIKASAAHDIYVDYPIVLSNTADTEFKVIDEKNINNFLNGQNVSEILDIN